MRFSCLSYIRFPWTAFRACLALCNSAFYIVFVVRSERHEARLASQCELIRLTHLPDALGPPCTARLSCDTLCMCTLRTYACMRAYCVYVCACVVKCRHSLTLARSARARTPTQCFIPSDATTWNRAMKGSCYAAYPRQRRRAATCRDLMTPKYF